MKIFHIDCGRKAFSPDELKHIIEQMGKNGYDLIELSIGNGGMRFLLDDMEIQTAGTVYGSEEVKEAIRAGNRKYCDCGKNELTEEEMEDLVRFAGKNGIGILPLLNTPGHMQAIVTAMEELGIPDVRYMGSCSTINLGNAKAVSFTGTLLEKYIAWFAKRGSRYFNMGCDEYANDKLEDGLSGFGLLCRKEDFMYDRFIGYVNDIAGIVKGYGMTPVMFNDGMYYAGNTDGGQLDREIICSYWTTGWTDYTPAPARLIEQMGHRILNTASDWYYVLGRREGDGGNQDFTSKKAEDGILGIGKNDVPGGADNVPVGAMLCLWCDSPSVPYTEEEQKILDRLIGLF